MMENKTFVEDIRPPLFCLSLTLGATRQKNRSRKKEGKRQSSSKNRRDVQTSLVASIIMTGAGAGEDANDNGSNIETRTDFESRSGKGCTNKRTVFFCIQNLLWKPSPDKKIFLKTTATTTLGAHWPDGKWKKKCPGQKRIVRQEQMKTEEGFFLLSVLWGNRIPRLTRGRRGNVRLRRSNLSSAILRECLTERGKGRYASPEACKYCSTVVAGLFSLNL